MNEKFLRCHNCLRKIYIPENDGMLRSSPTPSIPITKVFCLRKECIKAHNDLSRKLAAELAAKLGLPSEEHNL